MIRSWLMLALVLPWLAAGTASVAAPPEIKPSKSPAVLWYSVPPEKQVKGGVTEWKETRRLAGHTGSITNLAFSPDGKLLASASKDKSVRIWEVETGKLVRKIEWPADGAWQMSFSPDGKLLAVSSFQYNILVFEVATGQMVAQLEGHTNGVMGIGFLPDGKELVSASLDGTMRRWNVAKEKQVSKFELPAPCLTNLSLSADGKRMVCGLGDNSESVFDVVTGRCIARIEKPADAQSVVAAPSLSAKGDRVIGAWHSAWLREYDVNGAKQLREWKISEGDEFTKAQQAWVGQSQDGSLAVAESWRGLLAVRPGTDEILGYMPLLQSQGMCAAVSRDGRWVAAGGGYVAEQTHLAADYAIYLWKGGPEKSVSHGAAVRDLSASDDGKVVASLGADGTVKVWDGESLELRETLTGNKEQRFVAVDHAGKQVMTGGVDGLVSIWDLPAGAHRTVQCEGVIEGIAYAGSGEAVVACVKGVQFIDTSAGTAKEAMEVGGGSVTCVAVSRDGRKIVTGVSDKTLRLWDAASRREISRLERPRPGDITAVAFSADGNRVLAVDSTYGGLAYDTKTGEAVRQFFNPRSADKTGIVMSPDGDTVLTTGGHDGRALTWNMQFDAHDNKGIGSPGGLVDRAVFGVGGRVIASNGSGAIMFYTVKSQQDGDAFPRIAGSSAPNFLCVSDVNGLGATTDFSAGVVIWDLEHHKVLKHLETEKSLMGSFSHDGKWLALKAPTGVHIYRTEIGELAYDIKLQGLCQSMAISSDGKFLALGIMTYPKGTNTEVPLVRLWDLAAGKVVQELNGHTQQIMQLAFSDDSKLIVSNSGMGIFKDQGKKQVDVSDKTGRVWEVSSGKLLWESPVPTGQAAFLPGKELLVAEPTGGLHVYDTEQFKQVRTGYVRLTSQLPERAGMSVSPDGKVCILIPVAGAARVLDLSSMEETGQMPDPHQMHAKLLFLSNGQRAMWQLEGNGFDMRLILEAGK